MNTQEKVNYLCSMISVGVKDKDRDSIRSHLEDLNLFLQENNLIAE